MPPWRPHRGSSRPGPAAPHRRSDPADPSSLDLAERPSCVTRPPTGVSLPCSPCGRDSFTTRTHTQTSQSRTGSPRSTTTAGRLNTAKGSHHTERSDGAPLGEDPPRPGIQTPGVKRPGPAPQPPQPANLSTPSAAVRSVPPPRASTAASLTQLSDGGASGRFRSLSSQFRSRSAMSTFTRAADESLAHMHTSGPWICPHRRSRCRRQARRAAVR